MLPLWHMKDPGYSAAGGRLHLNSHTPMTQRSQSGLTMPLSRHSVGTYPEMTSRKLSENVWPQLSQLTEPLWTDPGLKCGISTCKLISTSKKKEKKKSADGEWMVEHSPKILASEEKATTTTSLCAKVLCWQSLVWQGGQGLGGSCWYYSTWNMCTGSTSLVDVLFRVRQACLQISVSTICGPVALASLYDLCSDFLVACCWGKMSALLVSCLKN